MTRFTDGSRTVEITMATWGESNWSCGWGEDWSEDFFEVGSLPYDEETNTYKVDDVFYLIQSAEEWRTGTGDFWEDGENEFFDPDDRLVCITEV